jgi:hypothetical protein
MGSPSHSGYNVHSAPKCEGSINYQTWMSQVKSSLELLSAWNFIDNTVVALVKDDAQRDFQYQEQEEQFDAKQAQARNIILSTCRPSIQKSLKDIKDPKGLLGQASFHLWVRRFAPRCLGWLSFL